MINIDVQQIKEARVVAFKGFDMVQIPFGAGSGVKLYFPNGKGQSVADAINAAVDAAETVGVA